MQISWGAPEIRITLTPVGRPMGREPKTGTVFREYGDVKLRIVQTIASNVGGEVIYFEAVAGGVPRQVLPVAGWKSSLVGDYPSYVVNFLDAAFSKDMTVMCYGASRMKWRLSVSTSSGEVDPTDNGSDRDNTGTIQTGRDIEEPNGLRTEF